MQPSAYFLIATIIITIVASGVLCAAIMTDYWELIEFDKSKVESLAAKHNGTHSVLWLFGGSAARVSITRPSPAYLRASTKFMEPMRLRRRRGAESTASARRDDPPQESSSTVSNVFLVPMHGGIWTLCVSLHEDQRKQLQALGFTEAHCINYLSPELVRMEEGRADWQHRMQNLSISCSLVCLIILGSSALVGSLGVIKRVISAVLVTGVMYLLAATFAMFTLFIMHFKRQGKRDCGLPESVRHLAPEYHTARIFSTGWGLDLGWLGVCLCAFTSFMWILLSKIMRYNPLVTLVNSQ